MKIGIIPINIGMNSLQQMTGLARFAEEQGLESVWTFEHVLVPLNYQSRYPYHHSGKMGTEPETVFIDPLIALTAVAASTSTLRLGTGVNILSQVNPLYAAKQVASLDLLSNGRVEYGVGIGWLQEEFNALGVPFARRGARFDDYLTAIRKLWSGDEVQHQSEFIDWQGFKSYPVPVQQPMRVVIGGIKGRLHERVARFGNGWFAPTTDTAELARHFGLIRKACEAIDRDFNDIEMTCMWPGKGGSEAIRAYEQAGVHRLVVPLQALGGDPRAGIEQLAELI